MGHDRICSWLGLPAGSWPPNHYVLLGLQPGEGDLVRIEEHVYERLVKVRHYQLNHPDQATEAMNRLAQAFTCLTDPAARKEYDASLSSPKHVEPATEMAAPIAGPDADPLAWLFGPQNQLPSPMSTPFPAPATATPTVADWSKAPPPTRASAKTDVAGNGAPTVPVPPAVVPPLPPPTIAAPADPVLETARSSAEARRGLGTKRALYQRVACTRQLLYAWDQAGKYLNQPRRRLTRLTEATELIRQLNDIRDLLPEFPPLLGEAGQPGYLVHALARQPMIVPTFRSLLDSQREALARDWRSGKMLLEVHRQFLRDELRGLRRKNALGKLMRPVRAVFLDQPGLLLVFVALLALTTALAKRVNLRLIADSALPRAATGPRSPASPTGAAAGPAPSRPAPCPA